MRVLLEKAIFLGLVALCGTACLAQEAAPTDHTCALSAAGADASPSHADNPASGESQKDVPDAKQDSFQRRSGHGSRDYYLGAFAGLLGHEAGHLIANYALDTHPFTKSVRYGPIPFFTIEPGRSLSDREHYLTASAGFNSQHLTNEWLLTRHPNLRNEDEPFLKGLATFNFWLTVGYAATAFAHTGPPERDTKGMADSLGWSESRVGAMILVPTLLDAYRYRHPDSDWARIASRLSKLFIIGVAVTADD